MKKIKMMVVAFCLLCTIMIETPTFAMENNESAIQSEYEVVVRSQVTKWVYRTYEGRTQMRLWSVTEGVWLTDWIDC